MKGTIFDIKRYALHDGPGIRQTVFFKGCSLRCWWCHNPESQSTEIEYYDRELKLDGFTFREKTPVGKVVTVAEVIAELKREMVFFEESGGGVTFSGGEPLLQPGFLRELALECRRNGISTVLDTCGYAKPSAIDSVADLIDIFYFDLKIVDDTKHREYTGVSNKIIIDNLRRLASRGRKIVIRFPVIPGLNDSDPDVEQMIALLKTIPGAKNVDLLPYHTLGDHKYEQFGKENKMNDGKNIAGQIHPLDPGRISELKLLFEKNAFEVKVGG